MENIGAKRKLDGKPGNGKKRKRTSKKKQKPSNNSINRMDEALPHLPEQIFQKLDDKSLTNSRVVGASWNNFIDTRDYPWKRFRDVINDLTEKCRYRETVLHFACRNVEKNIKQI